jgi:hypothetical protein
VTIDQNTGNRKWDAERKRIEQQFAKILFLATNETVTLMWSKNAVMSKDLREGLPDQTPHTRSLYSMNFIEETK